MGKIAGLVSCPNVALKQMKERLMTVHGEYSELSEKELELFSTKGRKPPDANAFIYGNLGQFGTEISEYIRSLALAYSYILITYDFDFD